MRIAVVDGQGGGIGKNITEKLRKELGSGIEIIALGTNSLATTLMLKAGANEGATGENAIRVNIPEADIVVGSISIVMANSMLGELTPEMAVVIGSCKAKKILLPINRSNVDIIGVVDEPLPHQIDSLVKKVIQYINDKKS